MSQQLGFLNTISASYVVPDKDLQRNTKPKIHLAKFGDGYEQRIRKGINSLDETFTLNFKNRSIAEIEDLILFFESVVGVTSFNFNLPGDAINTIKTIKVVCEEFNRNYDRNNFNSVTAKFRRVYEI